MFAVEKNLFLVESCFCHENPGFIFICTSCLTPYRGTQVYEIFHNKVKVKCTLVQALRLCTGSMAHRGVEVSLYSFITTSLELVRGQRHTPAALYPRERPGTHCIGGWVGRRAGLEWCGKSLSTGFRSPDRPASSQSLYRLQYQAHNISQWYRVICMFYSITYSTQT